MKASRISALATLLLLAAPAAAAEYVLSATLTGATEVPGRGDPEAGGALEPSETWRGALQPSLLRTTRSRAGPHTTRPHVG